MKSNLLYLYQNSYECKLKGWKLEADAGSFSC
ncbi:hypothetical protein QE422_001393 [Chryseobacterium sp. SORGH_AS 447]|nr:hypothetical protein [Chryseobacterium sp. SORGH_AS_0447]